MKYPVCSLPAAFSSLPLFYKRPLQPRDSGLTTATQQASSRPSGLALTHLLTPILRTTVHHTHRLTEENSLGSLQAWSWLCVPPFCSAHAAGWNSIPSSGLNPGVFILGIRISSVIGNVSSCSPPKGSARGRWVWPLGNFHRRVQVAFMRELPPVWRTGASPHALSRDVLGKSLLKDEF